MEYFFGGKRKNMKKILTPRLEEVAKKIGKTDVLCDIGCDHAYLPVYLVKNGFVKKAYACDVRKGPIEAAEKNIEKYNLKDKIQTVLSDGLKEVSKKDITCISICGMGGNLMAKIISEEIECAKKVDKLILQPMTEVEVLREFLYENGFFVFDESIAKEDRRYYNILCVKKGTEEKSDAFDFQFGKKLFENPSDLLFEYLEKNYNALSKALQEKQKAGRENTEEMEYIVAKLHEKITNLK